MWNDYSDIANSPNNNLFELKKMKLELMKKQPKKK